MSRKASIRRTPLLHSRNEPGYYKYLRFENALDDVRRSIKLADEAIPLQVSKDKAFTNSFLPSEGIDDQQIMTFKMVKDVLSGEGTGLYGKVELGFDHGDTSDGAHGADVYLGRNLYLGRDPNQTTSASIYGGSDNSNIQFNDDNFRFLLSTSETDDVVSMLQLYNLTTGTAADGFGGAITFVNESDIGFFNTTGQFEFISTDVTSASSDGKFKWKIDVNSTLTEAMSLDSTGLTIVGDLAVNGDDITTDGNMNLDSAGSLTLDAHDGNFIAKKAGTEFSVANSAYAGMILGYSVLRNEGATGELITIGTSMTVFQTDAGNDVKVTFTAPPSGSVEIEFSAAMYGTSKTVRLALSDNATFNEIEDLHTYDNVCITMDESDRYINNVKWVVTGLTAGSSYTYYIAGKSSSASSYISFGENRFSLHSPPIIVKAIALPGTIYTAD